MFAPHVSAVSRMAWPAWLSLGTPVKVWLWLGNRFLTWTGLYLLWQRWRARRFFWVWLTLINLVSLGGLLLLCLWLRR